jgi:hypothetical protein
MVLYVWSHIYYLLHCDILWSKQAKCHSLHSIDGEENLENFVIHQSVLASKLW